MSFTKQRIYDYLSHRTMSVPCHLDCTHEQHLVDNTVQYTQHVWHSMRRACIIIMKYTWNTMCILSESIPMPMCSTCTSTYQLTCTCNLRYIHHTLYNNYIIHVCPNKSNTEQTYKTQGLELLRTLDSNHQKTKTRFGCYIVCDCWFIGKWESPECFATNQTEQWNQILANIVVTTFGYFQQLSAWNGLTSHQHLPVGGQGSEEPRVRSPGPYR